MDWAKLENQAQLWQYIQGLQKLAQWADPLRQPLESASRSGEGDSSTLLELINLSWEIYEKTFSSILQIPSLGYSRELNAKLFQSFESWINFYQASFDYQIMLVDVWVRALEELIRLIGSEEKEIHNWRQLLQAWSKVFDRVFAQTFRSGEALATQGKFLNAAMTSRLHHQQLVEVLQKINDLPLRSEVDEVHRSIYELRKEVKALKKAWAKSQIDGLD